MARARSRSGWLWALAGLALAQGACDSCGGDATSGGDAPDEPKQASGPVEAAPKPAVLEGVVRFGGEGDLPSYSIEQMEAHVLDHTKRGKWPEACTPPKNADRQPVTVTEDGALVGVMVAASEFRSAPSRPPVVHEVTIVDCRLSPRLVVAVKGDTLRVKNEVDFPFMPGFGGQPMARTVTRGQTQDFPLDKPGIMPLRCGFTAPCGRTDVAVMLHPLHAITDAQGKFRMEGVPAGEPFVLSAWHPLFKEAKIDVQVAAGETKKVELTLLPRAAAAAAGSAPDGGAAAPSDSAKGAAKQRAAPGPGADATKAK